MNKKYLAILIAIVAVAALTLALAAFSGGGIESYPQAKNLPEETEESQEAEPEPPAASGGAGGYMGTYTPKYNAAPPSDVSAASSHSSGGAPQSQPPAAAPGSGGNTANAAAGAVEGIKNVQQEIDNAVRDYKYAKAEAAAQSIGEMIEKGGSLLGDLFGG